jgi:hypothetical protein
MKRKVIQIMPYGYTRAPGPYQPPARVETFIVLCDDGTMWLAMGENPEGAHYKRLSGPPEEGE